MPSNNWWLFDPTASLLVPARYEIPPAGIEDALYTVDWCRLFRRMPRNYTNAVSVNRELLISMCHFVFCVLPDDVG
jgi:hypothetical protein